jgi:hypothetical protein
MSETGPICTTCGIDWFRHGGLPHDFESPPISVMEQPRAAPHGRGGRHLRRGDR